MHQVRVLIVDDQETFLRAMRAVVTATDGFVVVGEARSGEQSLQATETLAPDLVLMDVHLPGIDGIEATRLLTTSSNAPVVLLLSTYSQDQVDAAGCGAAAYLEKAGFGPDRLSAAWAAADF
ncbi:MAG: response regulator transcription factor [Nocardioidaceae bacterium]